MLTLGSQQRNIDFEPEWRRKMHVFLDPAHASKKAKGPFQRPANLYWPCRCLSFGTNLVHSPMVHGAAITANAELLSTVQITLLCALVLIVHDRLTSVQQEKRIQIKAQSSA